MVETVQCIFWSRVRLGFSHTFCVPQTRREAVVILWKKLRWCGCKAGSKRSGRMATQAPVPAATKRSESLSPRFVNRQYTNQAPAPTAAPMAKCAFVLGMMCVLPPSLYRPNNHYCHVFLRLSDHD